MFWSGSFYEQEICSLVLFVVEIVPALNELNKMCVGADFDLGGCINIRMGDFFFV
jgi:hypothetical protein